MNQLINWAIQWSIPQQAVEDLKRRLGIVDDIPLSDTDVVSEGGIQSAVRLEASRKNCRLWRNNVGATYTDKGDFIRYGLANDSSQMNARIKSSDLIGIRSVLIQHHHVGLIIGQFLSREIKPSRWRYSDTPRERAQLQWIELINSLGGDACFANRIGTI